jgi:hypothetical protein
LKYINSICIILVINLKCITCLLTLY